MTTMECTENTSGVANPAKTKDTSSNLCQCFALPLHPNARNDIISFSLELMLTHSVS